MPVFLSAGKVERWEGVLFLGVYAGYLVWRLAIAGAASPPPLALVLVTFGVPLVGLTFLPLAWRRARG